MKALTRPYERSIDAVVTSSKALVRRSRKALLTWLLAVGTGMVHAIYPFPPPYYPVVYPPYWPQVSLLAFVRLFRVFVGRFRALVGLFRALVGLFRAFVGLFRAFVRLFRALVGLLKCISRSLYRRLRRGCSNIRKNIRAPSCVLLRCYYGYKALVRRY
jgi:hypothetical protein